MTLDTLLLLQRCLDAQQLAVGDPDFADTAVAVISAKLELAAAIDAAQAAAELEGEAEG